MTFRIQRFRNVLISLIGITALWFSLDIIKGLRLSPSEDKGSTGRTNLHGQAEHKHGIPLSSQVYNKIETLVLFIGYPRSGHTLIGALLDAHPNIIIANEYNIVARWQSWTSEQRNAKHIFSELYENSYQQATHERGFRSEKKARGRTYFVRNQWQGRYREFIKVIGDKKGGRTTNLLKSGRATLEDISGAVNLPIKFIHVVRNPFDNIATMVLRKLNIKTNRSKLAKNPINKTKLLSFMSDYYFGIARVNLKMINKFGGNVITLHSENIINNPRKELKKLCRFLNVVCEEDYLQDCAGIIYKSPSKTRLTMIWTKNIKRLVFKGIAKIPFLKGYSFDT